MNKAVQLKPQPYILRNTIQHYAWGARGKEAYIPRLLGIEAKQNTPYAELWLGAHLKAPSTVILNDHQVHLNQLISDYPLEILGKRVSEKFANSFPFLFKVLSVAEVLSIQSHPNKKQAEYLHKKAPEHYPDTNHKPELAIALDSLTALVGFKCFSDIIVTLERYPEMMDFCGNTLKNKITKTKNYSSAEQRELLRTFVLTLVKHSVSRKEELMKAIFKLKKRLLNSEDPLTEKEALFLNLSDKYAGDVGLFFIFLLNLLHIKKGQGIFIDAGIPHAYIKGNIVECMANSDNVVRVGLTPKYKDAEALVGILSYHVNPVPILCGINVDGEIVYPTSASEFEVKRLEMKAGMIREETVRDGPEIVLITEGKVSVSWKFDLNSCKKTFQKGHSFLLPAFLKEYLIEALSPAEIFKVRVP